MRGTEIEAIGELAGEALAAGGGAHQGDARGDRQPAVRRPRSRGGAGARRPRRRLAGGLRGRPRRAARGVGGGAGPAAGRGDDRSGAGGRPRPGSLALGALNGLYGNHLTERGNRLALGMASAATARTSSSRDAGLAAAFPDATSRLAVFVHGLFATTTPGACSPCAERAARRRTYGERLQDELSFTPVHAPLQHRPARSPQNGRELARLLDDLVAGWPAQRRGARAGRAFDGRPGGAQRVPLRRGGRRRWTDAVRHVFSPRQPASRAPTSRRASTPRLGVAGGCPRPGPCATFLNARSVGIKDLRYGACVEEDWCGCEDPDEFLRDRCSEVPFLPDAAVLLRRRHRGGRAARVRARRPARPHTERVRPRQRPRAADPVRGRQRATS